MCRNPARDIRNEGVERVLDLESCAFLHLFHGDGSQQKEIKRVQYTEIMEGVSASACAITAFITLTVFCVFTYSSCLYCTAVSLRLYLIMGQVLKYEVGSGGGNYKWVHVDVCRSGLGSDLQIGCPKT